jgi:hypothetical protein
MEKKLDQGLKGKETKKVRQFGYSFALGMAILFGISLWKGFVLPFKAVVVFLGLYHLLFALIYPQFLVPTFKLMNFIGKWVGNIITVIIFTVVFYLLFTPIAFILRLAKKDVIQNISKEPHWVPYPESANDPKRIEKLF